jgi:HEAT repeat protein
MVYQGCPLSYWIAEVANPDTNRQVAARSALRQMTPKVVPSLLRKARNESSPLKQFYRDAWFKLSDAVQQRLRQPQSKDEAINEMSHALHALGPAAGPALIDAMKDPNSDVRDAAAWSFPYSDDSEAHVLWLIKVLETPDYDSKQGAAGILGTMGSKARPAVPMLLKVMQHDEFDYVRETVARSLAHLAGPEMGCVARGLKESLRDALASVRVWSAVALWRINRDTNIIPLLVSELNTARAEDGTCHATIQVLGEAGTLAKAAVPAIRAKMLAYDSERALPEGAGALIQAAREALLRIDSKAISEFDVPVP